MNPKRRWRILQITWLRHFIYSKNAQAYINLNFGDIVCVCVCLRPWFNQPFGEELYLVILLLVNSIFCIYGCNFHLGV